MTIQATSLELSPPQQEFFKGRLEELNVLHETLNKEKICILTAKKGIHCKIGKSALAIHYANTQKEAIWIDARNQKTLAESYQKLSEKLSRSAETIKEFLSSSTHFMIFDGVKKKELLDEYLPNGQCRILITSRLKDWESKQIEIGPFSTEEAIEFLCTYTGKQDEKSAKKIAEEVDFLPTSLEKAAKFIIQEKAKELGDYFGLREHRLENYAERLKKMGNLPERNKNFVGRELALVTLEEAFKTDSCIIISGKKKINVETGLGGVGKTQLALQYAYRNADKYLNYVFWINAENQATLITSYSQLAKKLDIVLTDEEKKEDNILIRKVNSKLEQVGGYLLIFDNAQKQDSLKGFLPRKGGHLLITSRSPDWDLHGIHVFKVGVFTRRESIALIQRLSLLNKQEADTIAELTHDLPIAVAQAAAYIGQTDTKAEDYCNLFREKSSKLFENQQPTDDLSKKTVNVTWQISMEEITKREKKKAEDLSTPYPIAAPLMDLCAFFDSQNIPINVLLAWTKLCYKNEETALADLQRTLGFLRDFSMIDWQEKGVSIHPLVQLVTRNKQKFETTEQICTRAMESLNKNYVYDPQTLLVRERNHQLLSHGQSLITHIKHFTFPKETQLFLADLFSWMGNLRGDLSLLQAQKNDLEHALKITEEVCPPEHPNLAICCNNLGLAWSDLGQPKEAIEFYLRALEIDKKKLGPRDPKIATYFNNLGTAYQDSGDIERALTYFQDALTIDETNDDPSHPEIISLCNLGSAWKILGDPDEAIKYFDRAYKIIEKVYKSKHPRFAEILNNLGWAQQAKGEIDTALATFKRAVKRGKQTFGLEHFKVATFFNNLGEAWREANNPTKAIKYFERALKIDEKIYGSEDPKVAIRLNNIGAACYNLDTADKAVEYFERALKINEMSPDHENDNFATNLNNLSVALLKIKQTDKAIKYLQQALRIDENNHGGNSMSVARDLNSLGKAYVESNQLTEAIKHYERAYQILLCFPNFGKDHPNTQRCKKNLEDAHRLLMDKSTK